MPVPREKRFRFEVSKKGQLLLGLLLLGVGLLMPLFVNEYNIGQQYCFRNALESDDLYLIPAALLLVLMNIVRALPHYIGVYWVADSVRFTCGQKRIGQLTAVLVFLLLYLTYRVIDAVNGIHYDFGLPAFIMALIIILFDSLQYNYVSLLRRTLFIAVILASPQFLDVMPAAAGLPVGRGELSRDVKTAAEILEMEPALDLVCVIGLVGMLLTAVVLFFLLRDENRLKEMHTLREMNEKMRMEAYENEVQNRALKEMQYLVHDLKSPLSVVQTLEGVLRYRIGEETETDTETFRRMESALDQISVRISQLLTMDRKDSVTVEELLHDVMSQISIEDFAPYVESETRIGEASVLVNQPLFSRALVNLVQNAVHAVPEERTPRIVLSARREDRWIVFSVSDNGKGVSPEQQKKIWQHGYSGKKSSGMGLAFVQLAVERSGGRIRMESDLNEGTTISLYIPEEGKADGQ